MTAIAQPATTRRKEGFSAFEIFVFTLVIALLVIAVFGPFLAPDSIYNSDIANSLMPPSAANWFGTDDQGRDVFWRLIVGAQTTLLSAFLVVTLYSLIGVTLATVAAAGPRWLDEGLMRITDIGLALPGMIVALGFAAAMGASLRSAIIAMAITGWPITARMLRGIMRQTMEQPFVAGAQVLGVSKWRLMTKHVLPNSLDVLIVKWAGDIGTTVLVLASLSFIGVGAQPPSAEWGATIAAARGYVSTAWWTVVAPGAAVAITSIAFGLLGDIIQVRRDPSLRGN
ncbi:MULTISPECIES: ABC transporter permease [Aminobacter]|uniref:Dipeptide transport system permease protein DppC n=2 Tax=Aminobacter TaxID=31988 RepID=A0AAC8YJL3_AMIAI|nr:MULTISPECIES: ABC transporter permease [Aminobacter]AMS39552.1 Dipeptide transport system permease protein DppC [Aminobacter aminovorans]MBA8910733.1 peptide/nickel transport system permease protein [Aminobacter ciceronei]MBA9024509.1 peptide/nickel transport system permease protein [Aminobacter ciceronei]MBB3710159.1 peptide/nickel transport system permease protein [Aminobacter aminovorans]MRX33653.1 ABC transporter permease subunit [Aminobacter sp. MDW-2]